MLKWGVVPVNVLDKHTHTHTHTHTHMKSNHSFFWSKDIFLLTKKDGKKENARHVFNWRRINKI